MDFRSASIIATLLIGYGGPDCQAFAQYYPYVYSVPSAPPPSSRLPIDENEDLHDAATLPPEVRPESGPTKELPPHFRRTLIDYDTTEPTGTIVIDTLNTYLYLVLGSGKALRYGIGVGREGFTWSGIERISRLAEWPDWNPPEQMIERQPYLPRFMAGGEGNPLGARALYLGDTLYRIHGTNQPSTIGTFVSSGCIRLTNEDIIDLYRRVKIGTRVVLLSSTPAMTIGTASVSSSREVSAAAPSSPPSASAMPRKRYKPEDMTAKLQQVDVLVAQGQGITDATRQVGISESRYYRWRQDRESLKREEVKKPNHETPKDSSQAEVSAIRNDDRQANFKTEAANFEE
jgi:lipoprotein-anchoring transpeptidase ErfK/SrfK